MQEENKGLNSITIAFMIAVALFYDVFQVLINLIPILGQILSALIGLFAFLTFYLWFKLKGLNFANPKRAAYLGGGFLIELVPILNILPAWTLAVTLLALNSKIKKIVPGLDIIKK